MNYYSQFNVAEIKGETNRLSQTITGLPAGMYRVTCQAFYYDGADGTATDGSCYLFANAQRETLRPRCDISQYNPEEKNSSEWVRYQRNSDNGFSITYAYNNVEISGTKVYDHTFCTSDANGMPTDGMAAAKLFNYTETNCLNEVYVSIREGEDLVIGINKGTASGWVAADNFRLYYLGNYESVLDEDALPSQALADNIFNTNISLRRTLGDKWTSIVLPFDLTQKQFDEAFSESATISELVGIDPSYEYRILFKKKQRVADDEVYMEAGKHYIMSGACAPKYDEGQEYSFIINNNSSLLTKVSGPLYQLSNINRLGPTPHAALYDLMVHPSGNAYDHSETHEMAGGNMYHLTADTKLYGFRAYIQETDAEGVPLNAQQSPSRLSMRITDEGGQTTDISTVETDGTAARTVHAPAVYDLTGRAVRLGTTSTDGRPKGIYIVDGRKTVVR